MTNRQIHRQRDRQIDGRMDGQMDGMMNKRMDRKIDRQANIQTDNCKKCSDRRAMLAIVIFLCILQILKPALAAVTLARYINSF